jgi:DNA-binding LacI/PurR family transcriptional regulator
MRCLAADNRPGGVVVYGDYLALRVLRGCHEAGLRVPQDLAVVGFDDIDVAGQLPVPLTTVAQPLVEMGQKAAQILMAKVSGGQRGIERIIFPTRLIVRETCGARLASKPVA